MPDLPEDPTMADLLGTIRRVVKQHDVLLPKSKNNPPSGGAGGSGTTVPTSVPGDNIIDGDFQEIRSDESAFKKAAGLRLRVLRMSYRLSIKEFAELLDIRPNSLNLYELGERSIPPFFVKKLRQATDVTSDWLYFGDVKNLPARLLSIVEKHGDNDLKMALETAAAEKHGHPLQEHLFAKLVGEVRGHLAEMEELVKGIKPDDD